MLSITSPIAPPFQKICGTCHVLDIIISLTGGVYCNDCCSKSMVQKFGFLHGSIVANDKPVLLIIESKWFGVIVHIIESKFLDLLCPKQV